eukprot:gene20772-21477_t
MRAIFAHAPKDLRIETAFAPDPGPYQVQVGIRFGGICGSDLHYYHHGGFGTVRLQQPMILGHEIAGIVEAVGDAVTATRVGDRVAVSPSLPCNACRYCLEGKQNHCLDMRFYGSAMRFPHVHGGFRQQLTCEESQIHVVPETVSLQAAAMAEPLAVTLHAVRRAGSLLGKRVLITGAGPIGTLALLSARRAGASETTITEVADGVLELAARVGADRVINVARDPADLSAFSAHKG